MAKRPYRFGELDKVYRFANVAIGSQAAAINQALLFFDGVRMTICSKGWDQ